MKTVFKKAEGNKLIAIIGDEVTPLSLRTLSLASSSLALEKGTSRDKPTISLLTKVLSHLSRNAQAANLGNLRSFPKR